MPFFQSAEAETLKVQRMILHVVGRDKEEFEPQQELLDFSGSAFFVERIKEMAGSPLHKFADRSATKEMIQLLCNQPSDFEKNAQELSRRFSKDHKGNMSNGAFFIIVLNCDDENIKFVCLVKYDYREAIELFEQKGRNALRQIVQAFVKEKSAIQKFCVVRIEASKADSMVSSFDRSATSPDLTDYFEGFLDVSRERDVSELSNTLRSVIQQTLENAKDKLPNNDIILADEKVRDYLRDREAVDEDALSEALFVAAGRPVDEAIRQELNSVLGQKLKSHNIDGISFRPDQEIFARKRRRKIVTKEGVVVQFPGIELDRSVHISTHDDGSRIISIKTRYPYEKDDIEPEKTR